MDVVVDACAAVHANGMSTAKGTPLLELMDRAMGRPIYGITKAVKTECVRHGMGDWLRGLADDGRLQDCKNDYKAARNQQAKLRKKYRGKAPGVNDAGLQLIAKNNGARLLTDDGNLRETSIAEGIRCGDLFDLCLALRYNDDCTTQDLEAIFRSLSRSTPFYHPNGWPTLAKSGSRWPDGLEQLAGLRRDPRILAAELLGLAQTP